MLPSLTSSKKFSRRPDVPLGDRHHQPQVGPDDLVLRRHGLVVQPLDLVHQAAAGPGRIELLAELARPCTSGSSSCGTGALPARASTAALRTGWPGTAASPLGSRAFFGRLIVAAGHRRRESAFSALARPNIRIGNVVQRQLHDPLGPHLVDDAVDAGLGAAKPLGQRRRPTRRGDTAGRSSAWSSSVSGPVLCRENRQVRDAPGRTA